MRIRITKTQYGFVDGVSLASFSVGESYELPPTIASYLIALGAAEPLFGHATAGQPAAEPASAGGAPASSHPPHPTDHRNDD